MSSPTASHSGLDNLFGLSGRVAVITGGAGLLGRQHAEALALAGGIPVFVDLDEEAANAAANDIATRYHLPALAVRADITSHDCMLGVLTEILDEFGRVDILINNAANNPKMESATDVNFSRFENFTLEQWQADIAAGLTGAFVSSQVIGTEMAKRGSGVILNIASDLALIGPDQRIYRKENTPENLQPVKPVTYSVVKSGLVGLTRYLATYWASSGVRVNAISPGGVENGQADDFIAKLTNLIPMGRMAGVSEYQGAVLFLCSDASSYMTGANLVIDGGRTCW
jgi:NAD(P)-dependent dehydrogenase (short-subunit alcohol dehydrogenase family)